VAKPDCDDGWYPMSIELGAALDFADFTSTARTILRYVFGQIFGRGRRPRYAIVKCLDIARRTGIPMQHLYRALSELVASGVLEPVEGKPNTYRFLKDYAKWTRSRRVSNAHIPVSEPRLTQTQRDDCVGSVEFSHTHQLPTIKHELLTQMVSPQMVSEQKTTHHLGEVFSPIWVKDCPPPILLEREREKEEKRVTGSTTTQTPAKLADDLQAIVTQAPQTPAPETALHAFMVQNGASADMAAHAVRELATWTAQGFGVKAVKQAIHRAIRRDKHLSPTAFSRFLRDEIDPPTILPPSPIIPGQRLSLSEKRVEHYRTQYAAMKAHRRRKESENAGQ
jgi:hypothetical protein